MRCSDALTAIFPDQKGSLVRWNKIQDGCPAVEVVPYHSRGFVMYALAYIDRSNLAIAIPSIGRDPQFSSTQAGMVAGVFFFGYGITQIPGGYLTERWSARLVIVLCIGLWGLCAAGMGFAQSAGRAE